MDTSDTKSIEQDGCQQTNTIEEPPIIAKDTEVQDAPIGGDSNIKKKKTRRGKSKRKMNKPYAKVPWHQRRNPIGKNNKINRNRNIVLSQAKLHAPYNTNQFLMEVHMPEVERIFQIPRAPSARTRDSSFSVDSEENYFYSLPEDEADFLTKEFSSIYEDAQNERLASMTKQELIEHNLSLEAKVDSLTKRLLNRNATQDSDTDVNISDTYNDANITRLIDDLNIKLKEQEELIRNLQASNESLRLQNERLVQQCSRTSSSSADSESDSSSSSSSSSSSQGSFEVNDACPTERQPPQNDLPMVNGYSNTPSPEDLNRHIDSDEGVSNGVEDITVNGSSDHEADMINSTSSAN